MRTISHIPLSAEFAAIASERLMPRLLIAGPDDCWPFQGYRNPSGHGRIGIYRKLYMAHRLAYLIHRGDVPVGLHVCHHCDNPPCCNPRHLFLGTDQDNTDDKLSKGRQAQGEQMRQIRLRPDQSNRKLTADQVLEIRRLYVPGDHLRGRNALARRFGTTPQNIGLVLRGATWTHLTTEVLACV